MTEATRSTSEGSEAPAASAGSARPKVDPLVPDVLRFANQLHSHVTETGAENLARLIEEEGAKWKDASVKIVVAGEIKRGKTSFINALVGHPGLLPVDADVATAVYLAVTHGPQLAIEVVRRGAGDTNLERFAIDPADLVHYASMLGDADRRVGVSAVEVKLPDPLLERGLAIVDTPGVGGMSRGHRDVALASLQVADALVFTVSSQEPILRTELEFLAEASARIDTVIFVLTKVDANANWAAMLTEDRQKLQTFGAQLAEQATQAGNDDEESKELARRFPRLYDAPFFPVSSRVADRAQARAAAGKDDAAEEMRRRSGFADIDQVLSRTIEAREEVRLRNILNLCGLVIARLEAEERDRLRVSQGEFADVEQELKDQQARLEELAPRQAKWRARFGVSVQRISTEVQRLVARETTRMEKHYRDQIQGVTKEIDSLMERLPEELEQSLLAAWLNLSNQLIAKVEKALEDLAEEFSLDDVRLEFDGLSATDSLDEVGVRGRSDPEAGKASLLDDGIPLVTAASMFGGLLAKTFGTGGLMLPGLIVAAPLAYMRYKKRHQAQVKQEYLRVVREVLASTRTEFASELSLKLLEARTLIEDAVDGALTERKKQLDTRRKELSAFLKEDAPRQKQLAAETQARVTRLDELRSHADGLRTRLEEKSRLHGRHGARGPGAGPPSAGVATV